MAKDPIPSRDPSVRTLSRGVADASDPQIMRIVATVDAMAARGAADDLIAPLRRRLLTLRPARPLLFARLLLFPLDPLIVHTPHWRPHHCTMPRSAIKPMAQVVEAALGAKAAAIKAAIQNRRADHADLVTGLGASLWPEAGSILIRSEVPTGWSATGLADQAYLDLARKVGAVLSVAPALDALWVETAHGLLPPQRPAVEAIVRTVSGLAPSALPMLIALLLMRLPQSTSLLYEIETGNAAASLKAATEQAAGLLLEHLDATEGSGSLIAASTLTEAGATTARITALLNELDRADATPGRRKQLHGLRQKLDVDCKLRFETGLSGELLTSLRALPDQPEAGDIIALETTARSLRAFESEARALGSGSSYDRLLAQAAETVQAQARSNGMDRADGLRLVEILAGSEAALAMLARG